MRVIINGIEKFPRSCGECFIMDGETCECSVPGVERTCNPYDGRYDDCPMSPLRKPHGRLGDLSELEAIMREGYEDLCQHPVAKDEDINKAVQLGFCMASGRIFLAETVVPAEEEST